MPFSSGMEDGLQEETGDGEASWEAFAMNQGNQGNEPRE